MNKPPVFVAVTGGRAYRDYGHVARVLDQEYATLPFQAVVQGECPKGGADLLAKRWCRSKGIPCLGIEALWDFYGKAAGPIRNGWIFQLLPIYKLLAFPGDRGTADAVAKAAAAEVLVRDERNPTPARITAEPLGRRA